MKGEQAQGAVSTLQFLAVQFPHEGIRDPFHVLTWPRKMMEKDKDT